MHAVSNLPRRAICIALLIVLASCGGGGSSDNVTDPDVGFEPITCSSAIVPCA